jgi:hypothetical protein
MATARRNQARIRRGIIDALIWVQSLTRAPTVNNCPASCTSRVYAFDPNLVNYAASCASKMLVSAALASHPALSVARRLCCEHCDNGSRYRAAMEVAERCLSGWLEHLRRTVCAACLRRVAKAAGSIAGERLCGGASSPHRWHRHTRCGIQPERAVWHESAAGRPRRRIQALVRPAACSARPHVLRERTASSAVRHSVHSQ